jgi:uncharacterized protein
VLLSITNPSDLHPAPCAVLDSNVVLDWLVFRHPVAEVLGRAIEGGRLRWLVNSALRDELAHVLARGVLDRWQPDSVALWQAWERCATPCPPLPPDGDALRLRCRDPDDQKFIDLALAHQARWLVSRDRDLLVLARRARRLGLAVLTPEAWQRTTTEVPAPG